MLRHRPHRHQRRHREPRREADDPRGLLKSRRASRPSSARAHGGRRSWSTSAERSLAAFLEDADRSENQEQMGRGRAAAGISCPAARPEGVRVYGPAGNAPPIPPAGKKPFEPADAGADAPVPTLAAGKPPQSLGQLVEFSPHCASQNEVAADAEAEAVLLAVQDALAASRVADHVAADAVVAAVHLAGVRGSRHAAAHQKAVAAERSCPWQSCGHVERILAALRLAQSSRTRTAGRSPAGG